MSDRPYPNKLGLSSARSQGSSAVGRARSSTEMVPLIWTGFSTPIEMEKVQVLDLASDA
jgi:hypothetical protein